MVVPDGDQFNPARIDGQVNSGLYYTARPCYWFILEYIGKLFCGVVLIALGAATLCQVAVVGDLIALLLHHKAISAPMRMVILYSVPFLVMMLMLYLIGRLLLDLVRTASVDQYIINAKPTAMYIGTRRRVYKWNKRHHQQPAVSCPLDQLQAVTLQQSLCGRILDYGTVVWTTCTGRRLRWRHVAHLRRLARTGLELAQPKVWAADDGYITTDGAQELYCTNSHYGILILSSLLIGLINFGLVNWLGSWFLAHYSSFFSWLFSSHLSLGLFGLWGGICLCMLPTVCWIRYSAIKRQYSFHPRWLTIRSGLLKRVECRIASSQIARLIEKRQITERLKRLLQRANLQLNAQQRFERVAASDTTHQPASCLTAASHLSNTNSVQLAPCWFFLIEGLVSPLLVGGFLSLLTLFFGLLSVLAEKTTLIGGALRVFHDLYVFSSAAILLLLVWKLGETLLHIITCFHVHYCITDTKCQSSGNRLVSHQFQPNQVIAWRIKQNLWGRLFNYGTIIWQLKNGPQRYWRCVADIRQLRDQTLLPLLQQEASLAEHDRASACTMPSYHVHPCLGYWLIPLLLSCWLLWILAYKAISIYFSLILINTVLINLTGWTAAATTAAIGIHSNLPQLFQHCYQLVIHNPYLGYGWLVLMTLGLRSYFQLLRPQLGDYTITQQIAYASKKGWWWRREFAALNIAQIKGWQIKQHMCAKLLDYGRIKWQLSGKHYYLWPAAPNLRRLQTQLLQRLQTQKLWQYASRHPENSK